MYKREADQWFDKTRKESSFLTRMDSDMRNFYRLWFLKQQVNVDDNNRFVFTCKYGWLDLGHFINTALGVYAPVALRGKTFAALTSPFGADTLPFIGDKSEEANVAALGYAMEVYQWTKSESTPVGSSAWGAEDIPGNEVGMKFGASMRKWDRPVLQYHGFTQSIVSENEVFHIAGEFKSLLRNAGAIKWGTGARCSDKTVEQWIHDDIEGYIKLRSQSPQDTYVMTMHQGQLFREKQSMWRCLCVGDVPRNKDLAY